MKMPGRSYTPTSGGTAPAPGGGTAASPIKLYEHNFTTGPYSHPYIVNPTTLSSYLTNSGWANSQGIWASSNGTSNGVSSPTLNVSSSLPTTTTLTLTLNAQSGYNVSITSFSFYCKSQNNGYTNWSMSINGITVGSGIITVNNSNTLVSTGNLNVANAVNGLTGTITLLITLSGINHNANGAFRFDNFILNGYVQQFVAGASTAKGYRYGFNGKEEDDEVKGDGNELDFGNRIYDSRLGRFLSIDRLISGTPFYTPYLFAGNKPIVAIDRDGDLEIIIHVYEKIVDPETGKITVNLKHTTKFEVTTMEDVRGIYRTPTEVNVYYLSTAKKEQNGNMTNYIWTTTLNAVEDVKNTGLTMDEDLKVSDPANYYGKKVFAFMTKSVGTYQLTEAMVGEDFNTGEAMTTAERWTDFASGLAALGSLGRSGAVSGNMRNWATRKLVDFGFEEVIRTITDKIGINDKNRVAVLAYYIGRFIVDAKKGRMKELTDLIVKSVSLGSKGAAYLEKELKDKYGINLDQPIDKKQALSETIRGYLNQANSIEGKKVTDQYRKTHE